MQITPFPPLVRAATSSVEMSGNGVSAAHIVINMTAVPGVATVTPTIEGKDALGNYYPILTGPAIAATGITVLRIAPGLLAVANLTANDVLPDTWRINCVHSAGTNFTYSVCTNLNSKY